jgi:hypothetical protein
MNRQNKIRALDEAFKGNLLNLAKIKAQEQHEKVNCLVIIHNNIYRISSIFPKLPKHETFLNRDLTESEYKAFLAMFSLPSENNESAEIKAGGGVRVIELPNNHRYDESKR